MWLFIGTLIVILAVVLLLIINSMVNTFKHNQKVKRHDELADALMKLDRVIKEEIVLCSIVKRKIDLKEVEDVLVQLNEDMKRFNLEVHVDVIMCNLKEFANKLEVDYDE